MAKLSIPPVFKAECDTKGLHSFFRGDVGSIYLVDCPEGCANFPSNIWGTGIYTSDSSVCRAAIHAGVN